MSNTSNHEQLERTVDERNFWSTILLIVFVVQAIGFSYYTYYNFSAQASPEKLKAVAETSIQQNYGKVRKAIQTELIKEAPQLAEKLSKRAIASAPEAREQLERMLGKYFDEALEKATEFSAEKFRQFVQSNEDKVRERYKDVQELPEASAEYILHLERTLDQYLGTDLRKQAHRMLATHTAFNDHLERLLSASDPNELKVVELLELRMLQTARTIQLQEVGKIELTSVTSEK